MERGDEASPRINLASQALLVKMLIILEPDGIFGSNFVYLCHWYEKGDEASHSFQSFHHKKH